MQSTLNLFCTFCLKSKASEQEAWNVCIYAALPHFFKKKKKNLKESESSYYLLQKIKDYL